MKTKSLLYLSFFVLPLLVTACGNGDDENKLSLSGNLEAPTISISSKSSGEIKSLLAEEGTVVQKGDTLAIIDTENLSILFRQASANTLAAKAQFNLLQSGARKEDIEQAESALKQSEINYELALKDLKRFESLLQSGTITQKQFDDAKGRADALKLQQNAAKENLSKLRNLVRPEELAQAKARYEQSLAAEELAAKQLRDSYITAPAAGMVTKLYFEQGELIQPGSALLTISDINTITMFVYVEQQKIGKVKLNDKAELKVDSFPDTIFEGKVVYISPEAEFTPKNIQTKEERSKLVFGVKVKVENKNQMLKTGVPADVVIYAQ